MSAIIIDTGAEVTPPSERKHANGTSVSPQNDWPVPEFNYRMEEHPLWQEYLAELEANRQADIAEANRLADLELETDVTQGT